MYYSARHFFFFFNDPATTEIYTLSLHDALPISHCHTQKSDYTPLAFTRKFSGFSCTLRLTGALKLDMVRVNRRDRKSTRLNSSHVEISYAVFCLKKKKNNDAQLSSIPIIFMTIH